MDFPQLLTEAEAAGWLGVPIETVALWARDGKLLAAARTEGGQLLFYRWRVERDGAALASFAPIKTTHGRGKPTSTPVAPEMACGCRLTPAPGRLCRTGAALLAAAGLAEGFAATAPEDKLLDRIASLCRDALSRHLADPPGQAAGSNSAAGISVNQPRQREADSPSELRTDSQPASPCHGQADRRVGRRSEDER